MTAAPDLGTAVWRKTSYSDGGGTNCLEVADDFTGLVPVRDSKNPTGPTLVITARAWTAFIAYAAHPTAFSVG